MVMDAVGSAATAVGQALGLIKPDKAKLVITGSNTPEGLQELECTFNPDKYTLKQSVTLPSTSAPSKEGGQQQYAGTGPMTLEVSLFFDAFSELEGDVTPQVNTLLSWTRPTSSSANANPPRPCPPLVKFKWGGNPELNTFQGFLTNVSVQYELFRKDGTPVRAEATITITSYKEPESGPNPTSHAINSRRVHQVIEGDTLQSVAYRELGKPAYWRAIAELNGIDDPARLTAGTVLLIPSISDAMRGA
jgi:nucleoid-associated protein YgaU